MTAPPEFLFWYVWTNERVIDGDTVEGLVDLGFRVYWRTRLRLYGVDTPEMNDADPAMREKALAAKDYVIRSLAGSRVVVNTHMDRADKYGRWLAVIHYLPGGPDAMWRNLNAELITLGLARVAPW